MHNALHQFYFLKKPKFAGSHLHFYANVVGETKHTEGAQTETEEANLPVHSWLQPAPWHSFL